jgi:hypothetical protein
MIRLAVFASTAALLLLSACAGATTRWQPSLASQVPDSTPVRFAPRAGEPRITGLAVDWDTVAPAREDEIPADAPVRSAVDLVRESVAA